MGYIVYVYLNVYNIGTCYRTRPESHSKPVAVVTWSKVRQPKLFYLIKIYLLGKNLSTHKTILLIYWYLNIKKEIQLVENANNSKSK